MSKWAYVQTSMNENVEYPIGWPSIRKVKADLGITGKKTRIVAHCGNWKVYRMCGTTYEFTVTFCE